MVYASPVKNYIQRNGFVMVSNLLLTYQQELDISDSELAFIIKIMKNKDGYVIHDNDLDPTVCTKTLSRRRNALKAKGLLNFVVLKKQNPITGKFSTQGISYDLSPLEEKLQKISNEIETKKQNEIEKEIVDKKEIIDNIEDNSPLEKYKSDFEEFYGVEYKLTEFEINNYNKLSEENKKCIAHIFEYCKENDLLGKIVPKLSLFFKVSFRMADLKKYCLSNNYLIENIKETKFEDFTDIIKETYYNYYNDLNDNYAFYKACERIINRNYKGKITPEINRLLDKAYESSYNLRRNKND